MYTWKIPSEKNKWDYQKKKLEFRTLAHYDQLLYTANIESPAYFYKIDKRDLSYEIFIKIHLERLLWCFFLW